MMKYEVDGALFQAVPTLCFGIVAATGISAPRDADVLRARFDAACRENIERRAPRIKDDPAVVPYRDAMRTLGINPNRFPPSLEALLTRLVKGKGMPHISPLVDAVNAVSLTCDVPLGAHDAATLTDGTLSVRPARAGDTFVPFGSDTVETPDPGEIVYVSGSVVRTRRFIWRQSECGKMTPATTQALFPIDGFVGTRARIEAAIAMLSELLTEEFGARVDSGMVTAQSPSWQARDI